MKKRIGIISGEVNNGLTFQRAHLPLRHLKSDYDFVPIDLEDLNHAKALYLDALILFHPSHEPHLRLIHRVKLHYNIPVIVDLDDLITDLPSDHPEHWAFRDNRVVDLIQFADHLVVSTEYLKKTWGHLNKNITVIRNSIDPIRYVGLIQDKKPYHSGFIVGWTGGRQHQPDLYNTGFVDGLSQAMRKYQDIRAHFHHLCPQPLIDEFGVRVVYQPQSVDYMDYPAQCFTYPFDVCAVPLYKHPFNDAKSDLRLLDMAPFRIPLIASPRESFKEHQERVLFASDGTWFNAIERAYLNQKAMREMAEKAHEYVMRDRTVYQMRDEWSKVLDRIFSKIHPLQKKIELVQE